MLTRCSTILTTLLLLVLTSCSPHYDDFYVTYDNGCPKPKVAFFPVHVSCQRPNVEWNVAQDLTCGIRHQLMESGRLYLYPEDSTNRVVEQLGDVDYFSKDYPYLSYIHPSQYAVIVDMMEHQVVPYQHGMTVVNLQSNMHPCIGDNIIMMKLHVKIVDLRGECPKPVLQEYYRSCYLIPRPQNCLFEITESPFRTAHNKLIAELACRIEGYILESQ